MTAASHIVVVVVAFGPASWRNGHVVALHAEHSGAVGDAAEEQDAVSRRGDDDPVGLALRD